MKNSPIIDIVSQSGVAPFSYEIANSNSIPNPISPLGKKTDSTKRFKYRFSEDLPYQQLYRFQLAPEKNRKGAIHLIKKKMVQNNGNINENDSDIQITENDKTLITTPTSLNTNFSPAAQKLIKNSIKELENTHQNTNMPPSFHLMPEERLIKQRMPFLVLHGNPLRSYVIDYDEKVLSQRLNIPEKLEETQRDIDFNNMGYFEDVPRVSYNDYISLQNQIIEIQQQQRTKHFLPDHVPPYVRKKAQRSSLSMTSTLLSKKEVPFSIVQKKTSNKLSNSSPSPYQRPLDIPELNLNSKVPKRKLNSKQRFQSPLKNAARTREYSYVINADFNEDDEHIQDLISSHNQTVSELSRMMQTPAPSTIQPKPTKNSKPPMMNTPSNSSRPQQPNA